MVFRAQRPYEFRIQTMQLVISNSEGETASSRALHQKVFCESCERFYCRTCWFNCPHCN